MSSGSHTTLSLYRCIALLRLLLVLCISLPLYHFITLSLIYAAFKDSGWGVRPIGMGGAYTAVADDNNAPLWNPAGIARLETREIGLMYGRPYLGLDLKSGESDTTHLQIGNVSAVTPFPRYGALGFVWANFLVSGLYQEDSFILNYANSLHDKISMGGLELYAGFNAKLLKRSYSADAETLDRERDSSGAIVPTSPFSESDSKSAIAFDFGIIAKLFDRLSIGLAAKNINNPDIGFKTEDRVPKEYRGGLAYQLKDFGPFEEILPAFDFSYRKAGEQQAELVPHFGIESWFARRSCGVRAGGNQREISCGFSYRKIFPKFVFQIDYAFVQSLVLSGDHFGSHRVAVVWKQFAPATSKRKKAL